MICLVNLLFLVYLNQCLPVYLVIVLLYFLCLHDSDCFLWRVFSLFACHGFDLDLVSWICLYLLDLFAWNFWTYILVLIPACLQLWVCFPYNKVLWTDPTWAFCICISGWTQYSVYCFWHMHDTIKFKNDDSGLFLFCSLHFPSVYNRVVCLIIQHLT